VACSVKLLKGVFVVVVLAGFAAPLTPLWASGKRSASVRASVDEEYVAALAAANHFLQAWQNQDRETAILLLTDNLKQHTREERLEAFFTPAAHTQEAYEISSGKKLAPGRYAFTVRLFSSVDRTSRRTSHLVVTRTRRNDWAIDKLP
jgi:hypothetical protein